MLTKVSLSELLVLSKVSLSELLVLLVCIMRGGGVIIIYKREQGNSTGAVNE